MHEIAEGFPCATGGAGSGKHVRAAADATLRDAAAYRRLATATAALGLSRREIPNWMADVIYGFEGAILGPDGRPLAITDTLIDDAFNNDGSFRWLSDFLRFAAQPPRQRPQGRVLDRLRLLDLALRIAGRAQPAGLSPSDGPAPGYREGAKGNGLGDRCAT